MRRWIVPMIVVALAAAVLVVPGCRKQMVEVETGEIVLCTEGHEVSNTVGLVEVPADEVAEHGVSTRVVTCDLHAKLAALFDQAERALAAGDLEAAERAFEEIAAEDPSYRNAGSRLASIRTGGDGSANGGGEAASGAGATGGTAGGGQGGSTPGQGDEPPQSPAVTSLIKYVPDWIPGFVGQSVLADPFALFRDYLPEQQGAIVQLSVEVEQFRDAAHANTMLDERVRQRFLTAGEDVSIGNLTGYVGARPNYLRLSMLDGGIMISLEFYTTASDSAQHKDAIIAAARAIAEQ